MFDLPDKDFVIKRIYEDYDSTEFVINLYKIIKKTKTEEELYLYFSEIYDELFTNLILKKTFISNNTKKILETLSVPIYKKTDLEKNEIYEKLEKL